MYVSANFAAQPLHGWQCKSLAKPQSLKSLTITLWRWCQCKEKLAAVAVLAGVGHAEDACCIMLQLEPRLFIVEFPAIYGVTSRAVTCCRGGTKTHYQLQQGTAWHEGYLPSTVEGLTIAWADSVATGQGMLCSRSPTLRLTVSVCLQQDMLPSPSRQHQCLHPTHVRRQGTTSCPLSCCVQQFRAPALLYTCFLWGMCWTHACPTSSRAGPTSYYIAALTAEARHNSVELIALQCQRQHGIHFQQRCHVFFQTQLTVVCTANPCDPQGSEELMGITCT